MPECPPCHFVYGPVNGSPVQIGVCKRCGAEKPGVVWETEAVWKGIPAQGKKQTTKTWGTK